MDKLILVDTNDQELGICGKAEAHRSPKLHRAFSVFLHWEGKLLLQRRTSSKYHSGGLWANACCSHPRWGEGLEEAVLRRMREELGATPPVEELFQFIYCSKYAEDLYEYELDHVFLGSYPGPFRSAPEEIEALRWISFSDLRRELVANPQWFCSWFLIAAPQVLNHLEQKSMTNRKEAIL